MPTVTFGTGHRVTFEQTPSPQDIQDVATKMNIDKPPTPPTASGVGQTLLNGAKNIATSLASAPLTMATRVGQVAGVGIGGLASKITGDPGYYNRSVDATNQPYSLGGVPVKPVNQETPESIAGEGLSTVALGSPTGLPGLSGMGMAGSGAIMGALGGAGTSMQNNDSAGNVAVKTGIGGLLGYGAGALSQGISNHFNAPKTMEDFLSKSGATDELSASKFADAYRNVGINDLSTKEAVDIAKTSLAREIGVANNYLITNGSTDSISGELTDVAQRWTSRLDMLKKLSSLLPGVGKYVNDITPNLLRHSLPSLIGAGTGVGLLTNAIPQAASYLKDKFIGNIPNLAN